ncbi:lipopolysaccharide biosynthesis protein [Mangrovibacterium diazotrophicum]|uniref:Na+-driven multidrug efflux pump n=1 Tax=Mangrovibacterium diazotrophicum TaxID=1261403 RepID=A0A419VWZ2_9BACT|nr:hypothetical protein [Mangrovibacterium diazotrophicum]RKD87716.1 Na+-driven multidrug efflux pump [Mangrovibacterium diazotrophicum]
MRAADKVLFNTLVLYLRVFITAGITLYTTRIVLKALGEIDFGIFNLVSGVVLMLSFLNNALANSTQRFLSFYQGKKDIEKQKAAFSNSLIIHICLGLLLLLILEMAGLFLFTGFFNIPEPRIYAAKTIYHFMCFNVFITIISVPYNASLMAHENILWVALSNIFVTILKLLTAFLVLNSSFDHLILYALFTAAITLANYLFNLAYTTRKYHECLFLFRKQYFNKELISSMTKFAGWNLLGVLSGMGRTQGIPIILNLFYGTKANAAYGVSYQVSGQLNFFSSAMLRALNPQIMKSEGEGNRGRMLKLSLLACKVGFLLLAIIVIPFMFELKTILALWLTDVPEYTIPFCLFILGYFLISQLTIGLDSAIQALGDLKKYSIMTGGVRLLTLPIGFLILYLGYDFYPFFWCFLSLEIIAGISRIFILKSKAGLQVNLFFTNVLVRLSIPTIASVSTCYLVSIYVSNFPWRFLVTGSISALALTTMVLISGLTSWEREVLIKIFERLKSKIGKKK